MPNPYRRDAARLKAEIVARVDAGETLRAVCALPGMPAALTVRTWAKNDAAFGAALATARRGGTWRRLWVFDEARAAAFLARARAGEPIKALLGQPGMPTRRAFHRWKTAQPPFAEAVFALRQRRDANIRALGFARRRAFDQALADRIIVRLNKGQWLKDVLREDAELPGKATLARWRREAPEFDGVVRTILAVRGPPVRPVPEPLVEEIVDHIVEGGSFASFSRLPGAPTWGTLHRWLRDPAYAEAVTQACAFREEWYEDHILMAGERAAPGSVGEKARAVGRLKQQLARLRHHPPKPPMPRRRNRSRGQPAP